MFNLKVHQVIKETNKQLPVQLPTDDEGSDGDDDGGITFGTTPIPGNLLASCRYKQICD